MTRRTPEEAAYSKIILNTRLLNACLFDRATHKARKGFEQEYTQYERIIKEIAKLKGQDLNEAVRLIQKAATVLILTNPRVFTFYLKGAYQAYKALQELVGRSLEGFEEWFEMEIMIEKLNEIVTKMMQLESTNKIQTLIDSHDFESLLANLFVYQAKLLDKEAYSKIISYRKETLYSAMAVFSQVKKVRRYESEREKEAQRIARQIEKPKTTQMSKRAKRRKVQREAHNNQSF